MGILYVVATPIGNLDDISKRALDTLNSVDLIACEDTRTSGVLLKHFNIVKKTVSYHKFNEKGKSNSLINDLLNGKNIALISDAGCPCISDPGSILVNEAIKNNIEVIAIPGASATITSLMSSGMDTTSFSFYGFLDRENKKIVDSLEKIKSDSSNIAIIYESPKRIVKLLEKVDEVLNNPYICLCNDLTKKFEKKYYGKTKDIINELNNNPKTELGEYVLLIEKNKETTVLEDKLSIESLIIDEMIKSNCTMKEAIKLVSDKYKINKNEVYNSSLNIKKLFDRK
jgi:16S rRNA (cytidine1402-2'-O)-methyltransferase